MILAILQARVSSSRLYSKVLKNILGKKMLALQIERISRSKLIDKLVVATSNNKEDDPIEKLCNELGVDCYRGDLDDVLKRFYDCAAKYRPDHIVRLTGDCPLTDWEIIDQVISCHLSNNFDYTSNTINPSFADGLDVEVLTFKCLKESYRNAKLSYQREHVTQYAILNPNYKIGSFESSKEEDTSLLRWTVDEQKDFDFVTEIYERLYPKNQCFKTKDILELLRQNPDLLKINSNISRNEGLKKSLNNKNYEQ